MIYLFIFLHKFCHFLHSFSVRYSKNTLQWPVSLIIFMSLLLHSALRSESVCYVLTVSLSFSPTSGSTLACTGASTPGWTAGPKSTSPATWPPTPASGWWEKSRKACCRAPRPASLKSSTISALTSTGWSTELCSLTRLRTNRSFTEILPSCRYRIQLPKSIFKWDVISPPLYSECFRMDSGFYCRLCNIWEVSPPYL